MHKTCLPYLQAIINEYLSLSLIHTYSRVTLTTGTYASCTVYSNSLRERQHQEAAALKMRHDWLPNQAMETLMSGVDQRYSGLFCQMFFSYLKKKIILKSYFQKNPSFPLFFGVIAFFIRIRSQHLYSVI